MSKGKYGLVCVAHPDDETLFFGGVLQRRISKSSMPWTVVCVTDGNADGQGDAREKQFRKACRELGVKRAEWWGFADRFEERLDVAEIRLRLEDLPIPQEIYTHGPIGEYGHPHHQDVCYATHAAFPDHPKLFASAYNAYPEFQITLTPKEFERKARILTRVYGSETQRFLNLLPATSAEGYLRLDRREIEALYEFLARGGALRPDRLQAYRWLAPYLKANAAIERPF
jgi:LmbE family N-acetylglucosaminyl deacetylase